MYRENIIVVAVLTATQCRKSYRKSQHNVSWSYCWEYLCKVAFLGNIISNLYIQCTLLIHSLQSLVCTSTFIFFEVQQVSKLSDDVCDVTLSVQYIHTGRA